MAPYKPLFHNPHLQTILANYWKRPVSEDRFPIERRLFRTEPDVQVLCLDPAPGGTPRRDRDGPRSGRLRRFRIYAFAQRRGAGIRIPGHRFHMRTCGGTEHLCQTLYHAGLTSDLLAVLRQLGRPPVFLVGFSLGGNVVLKLAGELGRRRQRTDRGVCAVSTPLDLAACARRIARARQSLLRARFVRRMRARLCATGRYAAAISPACAPSMDLDDRITAPSFGFGNAANYYRTQSAIGYLDAIRVPALLIQAKDDTFIPFEIFESAAVRSNPRIELLATEHGGHLGFLGRGASPVLGGSRDNELDLANR